MIWTLQANMETLQWHVSLRWALEGSLKVRNPVDLIANLQFVLCSCPWTDKRVTH